MDANDILVKNLSDTGVKITKREHGGVQVDIRGVVNLGYSIKDKIQKLLPGYLVKGDGIIIAMPSPKTKAPAPDSRW